MRLLSRPTHDSEHEQALFTVADVFKALAEQAGTREARADQERWAQHIASAAPLQKERAVANGARDWAGARAQLRASLRARDLGETANLRETVTALTTSLTRLLGQTHAGDARTVRAMQGLRDAVASGTLDELKRCAVETVETVTTILAARERETREQLRQMQEHTGALQTRLTEAERAKHVDHLTQLVNRRGFDLAIAQASQSAHQFGEASVVMILDLDHFKRVNDAHGHAAGDTVLRAVSRALSLAFPRRSDCVARYGGEELAVVLRGLSVREAIPLAERALRYIRELHIDVGTTVLTVTASAGLAVIDADATAAVKRADAALYRAKEAGRDRLVVA